ncbi:MAG: DUF2157 domain-containing protein, partial [Mastigocladus sp. ERB_26_1]
MSSPLDRPLNIEIRLPSYHPQLLQGLDTWLRLGLISDTQVRQLCREYLVCKVVLESQIQPEPEKATVTSTSVQPVTTNKVQPPPEPVKPNFATEILQSLLSELSVRWLLFLGVFLVVLSSGVLAASQWERFPASGQYGVLFAYTLSFGGMSLWTAKQSNLRLTAQTLLIVTLLLVPINFWAMDRFGLWQNPVNWIVVAITSICLSAITVLIGKSRLFAANLANQKLFLVNILGLSYLHWGWNLPIFPLIALYLAVIGTTLITVYQTRLRSRQTDRQSGNGISLSALVVVYALLVLLVRGIFIHHLDVTQLGLAVGICGWLLTWLALSKGVETRHGVSLQAPSVPWQLIGGILLFLGWLVSVTFHPGQAIAVSSLGLWFFARRLQLYNYKCDFVAIFATGLQAIWLGWWLVPDALQQRAIATATQLTNSQGEAWALLSIALFPYVILMVLLTDKLYCTSRREIAKFGEKLTLGFASALTVIALVNPALRSLNLLLSTITLAVVTQRRSTPPTSPTLIYLTHITGVLTLCSIIDWVFPNLNNEIWATILLVIMVAEWLFSLGEGWWRRSAWFIGLGLAVISFYLFWVNAESAWRNYAVNNASWGLIWLTTPLTLTGVASRSGGEKRDFTTVLSVI